MDISYYKQYEPIDGKWYINKELGRGAFGAVYEVERHDYSDMKSAMKIISIPSDRASYESFRSENYSMTEENVKSYYASIVNEYIKEFQLMSKLKGNSNIVSYEDHDVRERTDYIGWDIFIRMELLKPMSEYFQNHYTQEQVIKLGIDICKALEVCQKYNIIHRDIKPTNIFVSETGEFKLGDFGVARILEKTSSHLSTKGTYTYMAPEVCRADNYTAVADIYSLGIVMYKLLNNNLEPFRTGSDYGSAQRALDMRLQGHKISAPKNADARLSEVILKACEFDPNNRYQTPLQMRKKLESLLDGTYVTESYPQMQPPLQKNTSMYIRNASAPGYQQAAPMGGVHPAGNEPVKPAPGPNYGTPFRQPPVSPVPPKPVTPVSPKVVPSASQKPVPPVMPVHKEYPTKKKSKKWLIILIVLLSIFLLIGGTILGVYFNYNNQYEKAMQKFRSEEFDSARSIFSEISWFRDSENMILECNYKEAEYLLENEDFDGALTLFEELKNLGYLDSEERYNQCLLDKAEFLLEKGSSEEALEILSKMSKNADASLKERIKECKYNVALSLYNDDNYEDAKTLFEELEEDNMVMECDYNIALEHKSNSDYILAMDILDDLMYDDFSDAEYQFDRCVSLLESENSGNSFLSTYKNINGKFSNSDGFYVEYNEKSDSSYESNYNLPHTKGTYFDLIDGVHYNGSDGSGWDQQWIFEKVSGNKYLVYDFIDSKVYELNYTE